MRWGLLALTAVLGAGCSHVVWYGRSDNRRHVVAVLEQGGRQRVRVDMVDGRPFRGVGVDALAVSEDGHVAYPAQEEDGWLVVLDGREGPRFDAIGELQLRGDVVAYTAERAGRWHTLSLRSGERGGVSGRHEPVAPGPRGFDAVLAGSLTLSASGRVAFAAQRGRDFFVVVDGVERGPYDGVGLLRFSADGARVGYTARRAGSTSVFVDGTSYGPYESVSELHLGPPDVWLVRQGGRAHAAIDGRLSEPADRVAGVTLEGGVPAHVERLNGRDWVIDGATRRGPFKALTSPLSRDARGRIVFSAKTPEGAALVVTGDERSEPVDEVTDLVVAGEHVGFIEVEAAQAFVVVDGKRGPGHAWAQSLALSRDGRRVAYLAGAGRGTVLVVDEKKTPVDVVVSGTLAFSRDGTRFGCVMGDRATKRLFIQRDDGKRTPLDMEELVAALSRQPMETMLTAPDVALLRRWVEAELEH